MLACWYGKGGKFKRDSQSSLTVGGAGAGLDITGLLLGRDGPVGLLT